MEKAIGFGRSHQWSKADDKETEGTKAGDKARICGAIKVRDRIRICDATKWSKRIKELLHEQREAGSTSHLTDAAAFSFHKQNFAYVSENFDIVSLYDRQKVLCKWSVAELPYICLSIKKTIISLFYPLT